jgi:catabolite regulation protein CreA
MEASVNKTHKMGHKVLKILANTDYKSIIFKTLQIKTIVDSKNRIVDFFVDKP